MNLSKFRKANISLSALMYHLREDPDFAAQVEVTKAHATDLVFTRVMQRAMRRHG
jgi:hypothetical protein